MKKFTFIVGSILVTATLQAKVIHVPGDFPTIQQGIDAAGNGDTLLVAEGTYYEQINFLGKPLTVASHFLMDGNSGHIDNTIIDGSNLTIQMDSASMVYFVSGEDSTSILCGFTIRQGKGTAYYYDGMNRRQGGAILTSLSGAKIIHNHITDNHVSSLQPLNTESVGGGGVGSTDLYDDHWVVISNNVIDMNTCDCHGTWSCGGGVQTHGNARISNNTISNNTCTSTGTSASIGGGFNCANMDASEPLMAIVKHNVIKDNHCTALTTYAASPGGDFEFMDGVLSDNLIENNSATTNSNNSYYKSGAVSFLNPGSYSEAKNNTFRANTNNKWSGGLAVVGWFVDDLHTMLVENNYFLNNEAKTGGAFGAYSNPVMLQNNVFSGNRASHNGGAIYCDNQKGVDFSHMVTSINNSFSGNKADQQGGAIYTGPNHAVKPLVINSIFWGDMASEGAEIYTAYPSDTLEIANSDFNAASVHGTVLDGLGNINEDPQFSDTVNLIPSISSPVLDKGTDSYLSTGNELYFAPAYDITGLSRPWGLGYDMGAYEYGFVGTGPGEANETNIYPNPFTNTVTISYTTYSSGPVKIEVFDRIGRKVKELYSGNRAAGTYKVTWNAAGMPAGLYFLRIQKGNQAETGRMILLK